MRIGFLNSSKPRWSFRKRKINIIARGLGIVFVCVGDFEGVILIIFFYFFSLASHAVAAPGCVFLFYGKEDSIMHRSTIPVRAITFRLAMHAWWQLGGWIGM